MHKLHKSRFVKSHSDFSKVQKLNKLKLMIYQIIEINQQNVGEFKEIGESIQVHHVLIEYYTHE